MAGSDKRQRNKTHRLRCTQQEFNAIAAKADGAGKAIGAFLREAALGDAGPRAQRRPPADHVALRQIIGQLGKIGSNLNQIARALNIGERADLPELTAALRAYTDTRNAIFKALGKTLGPEP